MDESGVITVGVGVVVSMTSLWMTGGVSDCRANDDDGDGM